MSPLSSLTHIFTKHAQAASWRNGSIQECRSRFGLRLANSWRLVVSVRKRLALANATTTKTAILYGGGAPTSLRFRCGSVLSGSSSFSGSSGSSGSCTLTEQEAADRKDLPGILRLIRRQAEAEAWLKFQADMSAPIDRQIREISLGFPYKEARGSFAISAVNLAAEVGGREGGNGARASKSSKAKQKRRSQQNSALNPSREKVQCGDAEFEELLRDHHAKMKAQEKAWRVSRWVQIASWDDRGAGGLGGRGHGVPLIVCLFACLLYACLLACFCLPARLFACVLVCLPPCLFACLLACLLVCSASVEPIL